MILRLACGAGMAALGLISILLAWQQGHYLLAGLAFDRWVAAPSEPMATRVEGFIDGALVLPDAQARWLKGRWTMAKDPSDPAALDHFAAVTRARPYDYHPALGAARWWAANDPVAPQFAEALQQAMALGPNESRVFAAIFPLARLHWHYLSPDLQMELSSLLVSTANREPALAIELARDYGFGGSACELTAGNQLAQGHCRRLGIIDTEKESP